ncbi:hypothetical protein LWI29_029591 [Acer saccharum]|uniref:Uncharacterized protein n=1 Tax=Acer saccharum TaxID=4024 RepID=A0AA39SNR6_ACESA|nr:hypothetical protein LWI29_029591 [Acer saccharum]
MNALVIGFEPSPYIVRVTNQIALLVYGQRPEGEKNFSERPCCHSRHHHRTAIVAAAFERPVVASAAEEPIRTGSDDRAAFVASTITPFLVELHLTDGDATIVSVGRFAPEIGQWRRRRRNFAKLGFECWQL